MNTLLLFLLGYFTILTPQAATDSPTLAVDIAPVATGTSIPLGAQRVPFASMQLRAGCAQRVTISTMTVQHRGAGRAADLASVYVLDGTVRAGTAGGFSSESDATLELRGPWSLEACEERQLTLAATISPDAAAGGEHALDVIAVSADVPVTLKQASATHRLTVSPSTITPLQAEVLPITGRLKTGADRTVARLRLRARSSAHRVMAVTFTNRGTASDDDLQQLALYDTASRMLSKPVAAMNEDRVRIELTEPLLIQSGHSIVLELHADVRSSYGRTVAFEIDEAADIEAVDASGRR